MQVHIHRIDKNFPLPEYQTAGAVAFDMYSRVDETIAPNEIKLLPSNLIIAVPEGYVLLVMPRGSTARKTGLVFPNSAGVIDQDFRGPNDEIWISVRNIRPEAVTIKAGERIGQGMIVPIIRAEWNESDEFFTTDRGGHGSTGGYKEK